MLGMSSIATAFVLVIACLLIMAVSNNVSDNIASAIKIRSARVDQRECKATYDVAVNVGLIPANVYFRSGSEITDVKARLYGGWVIVREPKRGDGVFAYPACVVAYVDFPEAR